MLLNLVFANELHTLFTFDPCGLLTLRLHRLVSLFFVVVVL